MKFEKDYIISEIIRTTQENDGTPLGRYKFKSETGIKESDWCGVHWAKWGDALIEAGYEPNKFNEAYDEEFLVKELISLIKEIKKFPTNAELRMKAGRDKTFPSHNTFQRLGEKHERAQKIVEFCKSSEESNDVIEICVPLLKDEKEKVNKEAILETTNFGFVYLMKSGKHYKIGRSNDADRRAYELRLQLPEKVEIIHRIKTDDPIGIEEYWHKRFKDKRKNGEWFELTKQDIETFKRRNFM